MKTKICYFMIIVLAACITSTFVVQMGIMVVTISWICGCICLLSLVYFKMFADSGNLKDIENQINNENWLEDCKNYMRHGNRRNAYAKCYNELVDQLEEMTSLIDKFELCEIDGTPKAICDKAIKQFRRNSVTCIKYFHLGTGRLSTDMPIHENALPLLSQNKKIISGLSDVLMQSIRIDHDAYGDDSVLLNDYVKVLEGVCQDEK